ncbi:class I SAM-dependent methyltransferase [Candidatus Gottesmanbacteria bacterium]|nr:class I SAM-dependent methyltransferase [Candidatus Gottesmanbacteria bacterium]
MENTQLTPEQSLLQGYALNYNRVLYKHDSPDQSRVSMTQRIKNYLIGGIPIPNILDIGSGPQSIEKQLLDMRRIKYPTRYNFFSLDKARIAKARLLAKKYKVDHVPADGTILPFPDSKFGLVFSNHAIDFMPRVAINEAYRVLANYGIAIFYLHHPSMIPEDLNQADNKDVRGYWSYLKENNLLFSSREQINKTLQNAGFTDITVSINRDELEGEQWWEVIAKTPPVNSDSL